MPTCEAEIMTTERPRRLRSIAAGFPGVATYGKQSADQSLISFGEQPAISWRWSAACQSLIFPSLWLLIGSISAIDTYLTVKFQEHLYFLETNPMANLLLDLDQGDASLLIGFKFFGSTIALGILAALYLQNRRLGLMVSSGLACFQVGLLWYLIAV